LNGDPQRGSERLGTVSQNSGYVHHKLNHVQAFSVWVPTRRVQSYLAEMINEQKHSCESDEKRDLLSNLVSANDEFSDDGGQRLDEAELIGTSQESTYRQNHLNICRSGNMYIFYFAGHEVSIIY